MEEFQQDLAVQGTADRLVTLPAGRVICLHFVATLKWGEDSFDEALWSRLALLMQRPPALPGAPGVFHPLGAEEIGRAFDITVAEGEHSYHTLVWWSRHLLPGAHDPFRGPAFLERCAEHVDHVIHELERRLEGPFDTPPSFLPHELRQFGAPGRYLPSVWYCWSGSGHWWSLTGPDPGVCGSFGR